MRKIFLSITLASSLFAASSFYTLDNVQDLSFYYGGKNDFISKTEAKALKTRMVEKLKRAGFTFGATDAPIFIVHINAVAVGKTEVVNIDIGLAEDVVADRGEEIELFAYTFLANKMIKTQKPYEESMQTLEKLVDEFIALHQDDNEE